MVDRGIVAAVVVSGCGRSDSPLAGSDLPDDEVGHADLVEICEQLRDADLPDGMDASTFDELVGAYRLLCDQVGVPLPPGSGGPVDATDDAMGRSGTGRDGAGGPEDEQPDDLGDRGDVSPEDLADLDEDERIRRAIAAGPQCDPAEHDLSMSEVAKAPAVGPLGSPEFDAELAKEQYRAPGYCLPEPYRSEWFLIADAYEAVFDLLGAYAIASNQGFEALIELGEQLGDLEARLERLQSDEVQEAIASTGRFFAEVERSGGWDQYRDTHDWDNWWTDRTLWDMWAAVEDLTGYPIDTPDLPR